MTMRMYRMALVAAPAIALMLAGCGDDKTGMDPDDNNGMVEPDPCAEGGGHGGCLFNRAEAGEIRIEIINDALGTSRVNAQAYFIDTQDPNPLPLPGSMGLTVVGLCTDMRGGDVYPVGLPASRTYADAGDAVTIKSRDGSQTWTWDKVVSATQDSDPTTGEVSPAFGHKHDILYLPGTPIDPADVREGVEYIPSIPGNGDIPAREFDGPSKELGDGPGVGPDQGIYIPKGYRWTFGTEWNTGGVTMPAGQDFNITWETDAAEVAAQDAVKEKYLNDRPAGATVFGGGFFGFAAFFDAANGLVTHLCIGGNTGELLVPASVVDQLAPQGAILQGALAHRESDWHRDGERFDLLGVNCYLDGYAVQ